MNKAHSKNQSKNSMTFIGLLIIAVGLVMFAITNNWFELDHGAGWPLYQIATGALILTLLLRQFSPAVKATVAFFGAMPVLHGTFFLSITAGPLEWRDMGTLWPVFITIPGLALLFAYLVAGRKYGFLGITGAVLAVAGVAVLLPLRLAGSVIDWGKAWPAFVVAGGLLLILASRIKIKK